MAVRRSQTIVATLGGVLLLMGIVSLYFSIGAQLRHGNLGSSPYWIDPSMTDSERFWISFPTGWFLCGGAVLLFVAIVRAIAAVDKSPNGGTIGRLM
jgi:ribose/xylose/arabinose/galactoside ABC-type transport system permease subunit